mgnify:CR=1 FL=1
MGIQRNRYSLEFKLQAVELSNLRGKIKEVAEELGISATALKSWKNGLHMGATASLPKIKSKEEEENIRLKKALYEVTLERDILKKAVGIFSKNDR